MNDQQQKRYQKLRMNAPRLAGYIDCLYDEEDWALIDSADDDGILDANLFSEEVLQRGFHRGILDRDENSPSGWRLSSYRVHMSCMMEGDLSSAWFSLPEEVWKGINAYMMDPKVWLPSRVEETSEDNPSTEWVLPLEQAMAKIESVPEGAWFSLHQCDCNAYERGCKGKEKICINWSTDPPAPNSKQARGLIGTCTREEAISALKRADEMGLVHCVTERHVCNCCTCCCINLHNYKEYKVRDHLLNLSYVAKVENEACLGCGACTARCPFEAISLTDGAAGVSPDLCWGCGVCRTVCPANAIKMEEIRHAAVLE